MKPIDNKPQLLALEVTRRCKFNCRHCRANASTSCADDLTTDQWKKIISSIADFQKCVIIMTGGEPTERGDILELISHSRDLGLRVVMATCGYSINEISISELKHVGIMAISFSLDGATAAQHDSFRQTPGAFEIVKKATAITKQAGLRFQINTTISKLNIDQVPQIYQLARQMGAHCFNPFILVPTGRASQMADAIIDPAQYEKLLHDLLKLKQNSDIEVRVTCGPQFARVAKQNSDLHANGCMGGRGFGFISHRGDIQTCGFLDISAGNLTENNYNFADIWLNSKFLNDIRNPKKYQGQCGQCKFLAACGGCRARAFTATGNHLASDPVCDYKHDPD